VWSQRFTSELKRIGLRATTADPSVWVSKNLGLILVLYVDDMVLIAREMQELRKLKAGLTQVFRMKDLGEIQKVLGLRVQRDKATRRLWIDQAHYIEDVLRDFGHSNCKVVSTPADGYANLQLRRLPMLRSTPTRLGAGSWTKAFIAWSYGTILPDFGIGLD
jgi:Reverse transcriptase (RNA-dependent DNA polymerase)